MSSYNSAVNRVYQLPHTNSRPSDAPTWSVFVFRAWLLNGDATISPCYNGIFVLISKQSIRNSISNPGGHCAIDSLYQRDCLRRLTDCIDLIITSPPYNVNLGNNKYHKTPYDLYRDNREHSEYISWLKRVFKEVQRVLKHGGRVAINICDGKNGAIPTH